MRHSENQEFNLQELYRRLQVYLPDCLEACLLEEGGNLLIGSVPGCGRENGVPECCAGDLTTGVSMAHKGPASFVTFQNVSFVATKGVVLVAPGRTRTKDFRSPSACAFV